MANTKARPFFDELCAFMTSGPIVVQVLEGEDAVANYRKIMGATDPERGQARNHPQALCPVEGPQFGARLR